MSIRSLFEMYVRQTIRRSQSLSISHLSPRAKTTYRNLESQSGSAATQPLSSILIANRGEIALLVLMSCCLLSFADRAHRRVNRTAAQYGIRTTTIYTDPDANSQHALSSPYAINLGHPSAYLNGDKIIQAAKRQGCVGIHPGYGFVRFLF